MHGPKIFGFSNLSLGRLRISSQYFDKHRHGRYIRKVIYAADIGMLFVLDDYATTLKLYSHNSQLVKTLKVESSRKSAVITDFAWSSTEKRLGIATHDNNLHFLDHSDNFTFAHHFDSRGVLQLQHMIWNVGVWISSDMTASMNEWSILTETTIHWPTIHTAQITQLIELGGDFIASAALDRTIVLWNLTLRKSVMRLEQVSTSVHSLVYSKDFDLMLSAGYELKVQVYAFDSTRDCSLRGHLTGHSHAINALEMMSESPLAITTDDRSYLKIWDLRTFTCVQTTSLDG